MGDECPSDGRSRWRVSPRPAGRLDLGELRGTGEAQRKSICARAGIGRSATAGGENSGKQDTERHLSRGIERAIIEHVWFSLVM